MLENLTSIYNESILNAAKEVEQSCYEVARTGGTQIIIGPYPNDDYIEAIKFTFEEPGITIRPFGTSGKYIVKWNYD